MNLHEYQAKELLARSGVPVLPGRLATTAEEVAAAVDGLGPPCVVKAQVHAGGRGKAGGIRLAHAPEEARQVAEAMLGTRLVTPQTGPQGKVVRKVWVERAADIAREVYVGCLVDRAAGRPVVLASSEGGVEIEEVATRSPEKILRQTIDPAVGFLPFQGRNLATGLAFPKPLLGPAATLFARLYTAFEDSDASLVEINPLVITREGALIALDAKVTLDDNGLYRHPDLAGWRDVEEEDPLEVEASRFDLSYISLNGTIGCMVNGAGLAMATMDVIKLSGGEPANFLDVGGGASQDKVSAALKIILADPKVRGILINIFGGIMRCDVIARGVIAAAQETGLPVPVVVRLEGTNVEEGKELLAASGLPVTAASGMWEAAQMILQAVAA